MELFCIYRNHSQHIEIIQLPRLDLERSLFPGFSISFEAESNDSLNIIVCQPPITTMIAKKILCARLAIQGEL
jgi:hypothetical protein